MLSTSLSSIAHLIEVSCTHIILQRKALQNGRHFYTALPFSCLLHMKHSLSRAQHLKQIHSKARFRLFVPIVLGTLLFASSFWLVDLVVLCGCRSTVAVCFFLLSLRHFWLNFYWHNLYVFCSCFMREVHYVLLTSRLVSHVIAFWVLPSLSTRFFCRKLKNSRWILLLVTFALCLVGQNGHMVVFTRGCCRSV